MSHWIKRKTIDGFLDMGQPLVPPLPARIALTDRVTGTIYYLATTGSYPGLTPLVSATPVVDNVAGINLYGAYFGPVVTGKWRLFVSSGTLFTEQIVNAVEQSQTRIFARNGNSADAVEVTAPGGVLTYTNIQL